MRIIRKNHLIAGIVSINIIVVLGFLLKAYWSRWPDHSVIHSYGDSAFQHTPFVLENNLIVVDVTINENRQEHLRMGVDTGNPYSIITNGASHRLKLNGIWRWTLISGSWIPSWRTWIEKAEIGGIIIKDAMFTMRDLGTRPQKNGEPLEGLLGYRGFLEGAILQIDYPARELRLYPALHAESLSTLNDRVSLQMESFNDERLVPLVNKVLVDGHPVRALLDTGSSFNVSLTTRIIDKYKLNIDWDDSGQCLSKDINGVERRRKKGRVKSLTIGGLELRSTEVCLEVGEKDWDVNIGGAALRPYVVTFDYIHKQVFIEQSTRSSLINSTSAES